MTFEVMLGDRLRTVDVERVEGDRYRVTIDGRSRLVDLCRSGPAVMSLVVIEGGARTSHGVSILENGAAGGLVVGLRHATVELAVHNGRGRRRRGAEVAAGAGAVKAPMPGRVVRVLVAPGDQVSARQPVVVVEAMKMENELRAPAAGRIVEVLVEAGAPVEGGRTLIRIE